MNEAVRPTERDDDLLLQEGFDGCDLSGWVSYVGGENEKALSWNVDGGALIQPVEDGLIRAILAGSESWGDYSVEAKIRIDSPSPESRAGLVFRDDGKGFYVRRFTRSSGKAQLMYHCRSPFGWHELATVPLAAVGSAAGWVTVKVEARGPFIRCFVGNQQYIDLADSRSRTGRVGFYACEAKATFDDLTVRRMAPLSLPPSRTGSAPYAPCVSFWFRETFNDPGSTSWQLGEGWSVDSTLCVRGADSAGARISRLTGAPFSDGLVQVRLRLLDQSLDEFFGEVRAALEGRQKPLEPPAENAPPVAVAQARAGIVLRGHDGSYYALLLERAQARMVLVHRDERSDVEEELGRVEFRSPPEDRWYTLAVQAKGPAMVALIDRVPCIAVQDSRHSSGYLGLFADGGPVVFADLLAASGK
ncbi:MAG: hypothetical protein HY815_07155 [Candidatus Riflebacteria bacterium]|nr:hypothetical protein [Candidatus Riflebacteria bacterium]